MSLSESPDITTARRKFPAQKVVGCLEIKATHLGPHTSKVEVTPRFICLPSALGAPLPAALADGLVCAAMQTGFVWAAPACAAEVWFFRLLPSLRAGRQSIGLRFHASEVGGDVLHANVLESPASRHDAVVEGNIRVPPCSSWTSNPWPLLWVT